MKNPLKLALALSFVSAAACGGNSADAVIAKMGKVADTLCKCKDAPCVEGVMKQMADIKGPGEKASKAQMAKLMKIANKMAECQKKIMSTAVPVSPPAPPAPPVPPVADPAAAPEAPAAPATP